MSNLRQLGLAMEMYRDDAGEYPLHDAALASYLGQAKLRCPMAPGSTAFNFGAYLNLAVFTRRGKTPESKAYVDALVECYRLRGPAYPLLIDLNHLPRILRADDQLYGVAILVRAGGSVERIAKRRIATIQQEIFGVKGETPLPCKPAAREANY